ncbi:cyclic pyranopterin phosphate synthase [Streptacidiphilus sp. MAP12-16]|uniref:radical SAM protein n=1 Tax=Streptacidiphilus sp. MAP12-16 TaxID=3156300 RepID=UPI00351453B6
MYAPAPADTTALANFAALRGQLRVSLTPRCPISCWFCHNEADVPPHLYRSDPTTQPRKRRVDGPWMTARIASLVRSGIRRVYFTGGEPLASPLAKPVLTSCREWTGDDVTAALITNGLPLRKAMPWLRTCAIDKVKVSLHYLSDASFHAIAKTPLPVARVLDGIDAARDGFERVELNTLVQDVNAHELDAILDYALERRLPVQFIELVGTPHNTGRPNPAAAMSRLLARLRAASPERVEVAGVGQGRRVFAVDGVEVEVIDHTLGRHHVGQCGTCPLKTVCVEGFWALRLNHDGALSPCLLRDDLRLDLTVEDNDTLRSVAAHVAAFTEGIL